VVKVMPDFEVTPCKSAVLTMKQDYAHGNPW
jgi:hypothetical protein